jgi:hypothetical protein
MIEHSSQQPHSLLTGRLGRRLPVSSANSRYSQSFGTSRHLSRFLEQWEGPNRILARALAQRRAVVRFSSSELFSFYCDGLQDALSQNPEHLLLRQALALTLKSFIYNADISQRLIKLWQMTINGASGFRPYSAELQWFGTPGVIRTPDPLLRRQTDLSHALHRFPYFPWPYTNSGNLLSLKVEPVLAQ